MSLNIPIDKLKKQAEKEEGSIMDTLRSTLGNNLRYNAIEEIASNLQVSADSKEWTLVNMQDIHKYLSKKNDFALAIDVDPMVFLQEVDTLLSIVTLSPADIIEDTHNMTMEDFVNAILADHGNTIQSCVTEVRSALIHSFAAKIVEPFLDKNNFPHGLDSEVDHHTDEEIEEIEHACTEIQRHVKNRGLVQIGLPEEE